MHLPNCSLKWNFLNVEHSNFLDLVLNEMCFAPVLRFLGMQRCLGWKIQIARTLPQLLLISALFIYLYLIIVLLFDLQLLFKSHSLESW